MRVPWKEGLSRRDLAIPTGWGDRQEGPQALVRNCTQVVQMRLRVTSEENKEFSFRNDDTKRDREILCLEREFLKYLQIFIDKIQIIIIEYFF